jgi:hypothetical protein
MTKDKEDGWGSCKPANELWGSMKCEAVLDCLLSNDPCSTELPFRDPTFHQPDPQIPLVGRDLPVEKNRINYSLKIPDFQE